MSGIISYLINEGPGSGLIDCQFTSAEIISMLKESSSGENSLSLLKEALECGLFEIHEQEQLEQALLINSTSLSLLIYLIFVAAFRMVRKQQ
jgi:hypothetical protein